MSANKITLSAEVIKRAARELGMIEPRDEGSILAAIDDYFNTLTDGQYSPMSGEHNNASNRTEVYDIAKKHGVDPARMMDYLNDTSIFDKFQKISISEGMIPDYVGTRIKSKVNPQGYKKHMAAAVVAIIGRINKGANLTDTVKSISQVYSIPMRDLLRAVETETTNDGGYGVRENSMRKNNRTKSVKHQGDIKGKQKGSNPVQKNLKSVSSGGRHSDKKNDYKRNGKHKDNYFEGYRVLPAIDRNRYVNREQEGLEGPYSNKHGRVYYYDTQAGKYYDPDTDLFMAVDDVMEAKVNDRLQESINEYINLLEGKEVSAHQAKLMNHLENINAEYLHDGDVILVSETLYLELLSKFPQYKGMIQKSEKLRESTMSGNIAGNAQPIGDIQKRRGIAEIEHERMEDGEQELEEYDRKEDAVASRKIVNQALRDGGELVVVNRKQRHQVLKFDYDANKWYDDLEGMHFTNKDLIQGMTPRNGEVYWEYN